MRDVIVQRFPLHYERYIEVFGGGGWVLFHKPPRNDFEVYNDRKRLLVNLYRCVRDKHDELIDELRYALNSREEFDRIRAELARDKVNLSGGQREGALGHIPVCTKSMCKSKKHPTGIPVCTKSMCKLRKHLSRHTSMHKKRVQIKERRQDLWKHVCTRFRHRRTGRFFFG